jgi:hypothetical protein
MSHKSVRAALITSLFLSSLGWATQPIRIDGSTEAAADASFQQMIQSLKPDEQQALAIALVQINLAGATSAEDMLRTPSMRNPSAGHIRTKIDGMSAAEIIDYAKTVATTKAFIKGQEPGVPKDLLRPLVGGAPSNDLADTVWVIDDTINGQSKRDAYRFNPDHTMTLIESDKTQNGVSRWERMGEEVRLTFGDGYSVKLGRVVDATTMQGDGGNEAGFRWTWTARKRLSAQ